MPKMFSPSTMFLKTLFCRWKHEKPASKVAEPAQIQPKSQFLFHKNLPPRDFSLMTLIVAIISNLTKTLIIFQIDEENFGKMEQRELKPGGASIPVTR